MIIGLCGLAGSGKDTAADSLVLGHGFVKVAFADPLKRISKEVYDFSDEQLWGPSEMRNGPDIRYPRTDVAKQWLKNSPNETLEQFKARFGGDLSQSFLTPRYALQTLGTEWGRNCFDETWCQLGLRVAKKLDGAEGVHYDQKTGIFKCARPKIEGVAISDVRFWNELYAIQQAGGKVIRIVRPGAGLKDAAGALHKSEQEQANMPDAYFDAVIHNDTTREHLLRKVGDALTSFRS